MEGRGIPFGVPLASLDISLRSFCSPNHFQIQLMRPIAPAHEYEVSALAALNNRFNADGLTLPRSESFVESHLDDYLVIRDDDGHVVGCVCIDEYSPSLVELVSLAVDPSQQRKGLGSRLIDAAVRLARKRGYPEIFAVSFADDLFKRCGFDAQDVELYPEKKKRYDKVSADEWTVGHKHCFAMRLTEPRPIADSSGATVVHA